MKAGAEFPRLTPDNHRETSPRDKAYNCIAWAVGEMKQWWELGLYWLPQDWPTDDRSLGALESLFSTLGYVDCNLDDGLEPGFAKVALYATSAFEGTHAARQLPSGKWTSKLGKLIDIEHDTPEVIAGGEYGEVMQVMKRGYAPQNAGP